MNNSDMPSDFEIVPRTCANCACSAVQKDQTNPLQSQMFCRRETPFAQKMRVDRPVIRDGKPVMMRDGKTPLVQATEEIMFMYRPTLPGLVCFDGWRPMGTQPGDKSSDAVNGVMDSMKRLFNDVMNQGQEAALAKIPLPEGDENMITDLIDCG